MRRSSRFFAGAAAALLVMTVSSPADAVPRPRSDEWWFSAWGVEKDVWPLSTGAGVTVAILDTGVNASLPELSGVVLKGADTTGEKGDGRKDLDEDEAGHGSGLSGLIAGQGGGTTGYVGIAPGAKILPVHVTSRLGDSTGYYEAIATGIRFAVQHHAKVINISQGITSAAMSDHCESGIQDAIADAIEHDVVVVASSGNEGNTTNWPELPGSCAGVLAVGAIDESLRPWQGTQRQPYVAVGAPGVGGVLGKHGQYYPHASGTSISAALVSGAIALIRSHNPEMTSRTVVQRLMATAHHTKMSPWNDQTGYGPIQITSAMNPARYPVASDAPNPVYASFDKWQAARYGTVPRVNVSPGVRRAEHERRPTAVILLAVVGTLIVVIAALLIAMRHRRAAAGRSAQDPDSSGAQPPTYG